MNTIKDTTPDQPFELPEEILLGNRHFITVDDRGRIVDGWSDGPHPEKDPTGAICINEEGGYQFRLPVYRDHILFDGTLDWAPELTEENPALWDMDGIPLYKYVDGEVILRSEDEIAIDRAAIPAPAPTEQEQLRADIDFLAAMSGVEL